MARESKSGRLKEKLERRYHAHWQRMLYRQLAAYAVVLLLWVTALPNPIKLLSVTFHELSHCAAALVTGGRVLGFAVDPHGYGITLGQGGIMYFVVPAGYIGSCLWGVFLYYASVRWQSRTCLIALSGVIWASAFLGWLNDFTTVMALAALLVVFAAYFVPDAARVFLVRLVGSACVLYAPIEVFSDAIRAMTGAAASGYGTQSDIVHLARLFGIHPAFIAPVVLAVQVALLIYLVRWTCTAGAHMAVRRDVSEALKKNALLREIRAMDQPYVLRPKRQHSAGSASS